MQVIRDTSYGPHQDQCYDLYLPVRTKSSPLVIFLHGGGWTHGSKRNGRSLAPVLTHAGYALASLDYGLMPRASPAEAAQDCANGIAHVFRTGSELGIATERIVICGHSAGGHLAALVATDPAYFLQAGIDRDRLAGLIALDGVFDLRGHLRPHPTPAITAVFGPDPGVWANMSPAAHASASCTASFLLVHEDQQARYGKQAALFAESLRANGRQVECVMVPKLMHMELISRFGCSGTALEDTVLDFLAVQLPPVLTDA